MIIGTSKCRDIEMNGGSIVYGLEGPIEIEQGRVRNVYQRKLLVKWRSENRITTTEFRIE
jgi:hypothetical protein